MFSKFFKLNNYKTTEKDLPEVKVKNTTSLSGGFYSFPSFEKYVINGDTNDVYIWNLICEIRNWAFSKFQ